MAKIPTILEAGRADGKLIKTDSIYDDNQEKFLSDKIKEIDDNHNTLNDKVESLTDIVNNNESDIETKLVQEKLRASNAENNLRETIDNITEVSGSATSANIVTIDTIPNTSSSNVQQALNELYEVKADKTEVARLDETDTKLKTYWHKVEEKPYIYRRVISPTTGKVIVLNNSISSSSVYSLFCLILDVSNVNTISLNKIIYSNSDDHRGGIIFLGEGNQVISSFTNPAIHNNVKVPEGAILAAINTPFVEDLYYKLDFKPDTKSHVNDDACIVKGLWDGINYNVGWWGITDFPNLLVTMSKNTLVRNAYYEGNFYFASGDDKSKVENWVKSENNTAKEFYIKRVSTTGYVYELDTPTENKIICNIYPAQTNWNNGAKIYDAGGNLIYTVGRNNNLSSFMLPVGAKTIELIDPPSTLGGYVFLSSATNFKTSENKNFNKLNKILLKNVYSSGGISVSEDGQVIYNLSKSTNSKRFLVLNVPVEANKEYILLSSWSFINGSLKPSIPVVVLDKDYKLIKAYSQEEVDYNVGYSTLKSPVMGVFKFTTPENACYASMSIYAENASIDISNLKAILCEYKDVRCAIKNEGFTVNENSDVTGIMLSNEKQYTDVVIWNLGDSTSDTGYGGTLGAFEGNRGAQGAWVKYFNDNIKPKSFINFAHGGYTITDSSNTFVDGIIQNLSNSYLKEIEEAITAYNAGTVKEPDYLFITGCTNDFGKTRNNPNGWSNRSFVKKEDINSEILNPNGWDYDEFMEYTFIRNISGGLKEISEVPMFKLAGAIRYIIERVSKLFPNCKFMIISSIPAPNDWLGQNSCHKEMKWIANRLSIPYIDVNEASNICMLNDIATKDADGTITYHRRFIADGYHPYGQYDTEKVSYITAGAMYHGKYIAQAFRRYIMPISPAEIPVVDWEGGPENYPHSANI